MAAITKATPDHSKGSRDRDECRAVRDNRVVWGNRGVAVRVSKVVPKWADATKVAAFRVVAAVSKVAAAVPEVVLVVAQAVAEAAAKNTNKSRNERSNAQ